jgi:hypothetical protein
MRKIHLVPLLVFAAAALAATGTVEAGEKHGAGKVKVGLSPVSGVTTGAGGEATFETSKDGKSLHYTLRVDNIENVTMAHIHDVTEQGAPGPVLLWLYPAGGGGPMLKEGKFGGVLAEGNIGADDLVGSLKGGTVKDLAARLGHGTAGVAVHTRQNPGGELWGVRKKMEPTKKMEPVDKGY